MGIVAQVRSAIDKLQRIAVNLQGTAYRARQFAGRLDTRTMLPSCDGRPARESAQAVPRIPCRGTARAVEGQRTKQALPIKTDKEVTMNRRELIRIAAGLGIAAAISSLTMEAIASPDTAQAQTEKTQPKGQASPPAPSTTEEKKLCPVCGMNGDPAIKSDYKGKTYYFCMQDHKLTFDDSPEDFVKKS
jgi:YHS domain-containing protein